MATVISSTYPKPGKSFAQAGGILDAGRPDMAKIRPGSDYALLNEKRCRQSAKFKRNSQRFADTERLTRTEGI